MLLIHDSRIQSRPLDHVRNGSEVGEHPEACATAFDASVFINFPCPRSPFHRVYALWEFADAPFRFWEMYVDNQWQRILYEFAIDLLRYASWSDRPSVNIPFRPL